VAYPCALTNEARWLSNHAAAPAISSGRDLGENLGIMPSLGGVGRP
jgi:hypothetical protein